VHVEITVRAIDVGFGNTKYVTSSGAGKVDCAHFPSLAFYTPVESGSDGLGGRKRTVCVPMGDRFYEVGPDVELAADRFRARQLHDGYTETPEYRALTAGALSYMRKDTIDLLVVGLPVAQYLAKRSALERAMTGEFDIGRRKRVGVKRAMVVAQPQGALFGYAASAGKLATMMEDKSLIIDAGARTFDWLVTRGMRVVTKMSHSVNRGVSDVLRVIAGMISHDIGEEYLDLESIDVALRTGKGLRIYQKPYDTKRFDDVVRSVAGQAVGAMLQQLDNSYAFENIVLVGGGAFLFRKEVKRSFPKHRIHEVKDPMYANVRGFQLIGEQYVRENPAFCQEAATAQAAASVPGSGVTQ
jgi:plasmid segregation protein ParM